MSGWVRLKSKQPIVELGVGVTEQCVFLDDDGKRCTVYNARPIQCRTYPWWPNMIANADAWAVEAVLPEEGSAVLAPGLGDGTNTNPPKEAQRKWSAEDGGCEGINNKDAPIVPPITIHRNKQLYNLYNADFPYAKAGNDRQKLLSTFDVVQRVISSTKKWVDQFVIGYNLCPFAESVFSGDRVRYRAFLGTDRSKIIERIRLEVLDLLATDEDSVATTLLMLPFAFPDFEEFYAFSLDLEDIILPLMEKRSRPDFDDFDKAPAGEEEESKEIQLAFFHPTFAWADTEVDAPLNFEKRAPFPTINLLRAVRVREYANQARTSSISNKNVASLEGTGGAVLSAQFNKIIMEALAP
ncbi:hypothetical protein B484DRAFT_396069 [Ochromonadaceae sp. CCMP2298]|nr:hypothetical protein B484DRAFT_396069 [Ochromonadaceae sp. CCMP2298]